MSETFDLSTLARQVNDWCREHHIEPMSGQAGEEVTERTVRFYRALGLLNPPARGPEGGYTEHHRLQLVAVRILQAQGLPLRRIRPLLFGRTLDELREIEQRGLREIVSTDTTPFRLPQAAAELWLTLPIGEDFLLVSRSGRSVSENQRRKIAAILQESDLVVEETQP